MCRTVAFAHDVRRCVAVACMMLAALTVGACGGHSTGSPAGHPVRALPVSPYSAKLAAALKARGFVLSPASSTKTAIDGPTAVADSAMFRATGTPAELHLADVTTPLWSDAQRSGTAAPRKFDDKTTWLVVYKGDVRGQSSVLVVFVDSTTGVVQAVAGFDGTLTDGAPCPENGCHFGV